MVIGTTFGQKWYKSLILLRSKVLPSVHVCWRHGVRWPTLAAKARGCHVAHIDEIADELPGRDADALRRRASDLELGLIARASEKDTRRRRAAADTAASASPGTPPAPMATAPAAHAPPERRPPVPMRSVTRMCHERRIDFDIRMCLSLREAREACVLVSTTHRARSNCDNDD